MESGRQERGRLRGAGISWERSLAPPQNLAGSEVVRDLPCPHPEPSWIPSRLCRTFPLGKLLRELQKGPLPHQAVLPAPAARLDKRLGGTKGAFSAEPRVGRQGSLAGCSRARGLAPWTCCLCSLSSHLMAARPVCFAGERSPCWTSPLQQRDGCI